MFQRYKLPLYLIVTIASLGAAIGLTPDSAVVPAAVAAVSAAVGYFLFRTEGRAKVAPKKVYDKLAPPQSSEEAHKRYDTLTNGQCKPQQNALEFDLTGNVRSLDRYFPIVNMLDEAGIGSFYQLVRHVAEHPNFDLQFFGDNVTDITGQLPDSARHLLAGHIAEVFFFRQDILVRLMSTPRHFQLYSTPEAYQQDGGVMGGCYNPKRQCIQLVLPRLFEGFNGATPGACPFLHEFGHMLDHFNAGRGSMGKPEGLYPGLRASDGDIFTASARESFIRGKRLELDRYRAREAGDSSQPMPIGHPYVFQNNGEFAAGYLEMFFRNPNFFAEQNPDLFAAYQGLFGYDPRKAWKQDFPQYIDANKNYYANKTPPKSGLTIPG